MNNAVTSATEDIQQIIKTLATMKCRLLDSSISRTTSYMTAEEHKQEGLKDFFHHEGDLCVKCWRLEELWGTKRAFPSSTIVSIWIYKPVCSDRTQ